VNPATNSRPARRRFRPAERGQVLVLFLLIFATCALLGAVAVTVGQMAVRRHQAQAVVDAAAFSGAAEQARGLNTIARFNEKSLNLLRGIQESKVAPYMDSDDTTWGRYGESFIGPLAVFFTSDWAGTVLKGYQSIFDVINDVITAVNHVYSPFLLPGQVAGDVVSQNFSDDPQSIFQSADLVPGGHGVIVGSLSHVTNLVSLTEPTTYDINGYTYVPYPGNWVITATCGEIPPLDEPCAQLLGFYVVVNFYFLVERWIDPIEYKMGRFYNNDEGDDVRFCYFLTVTKSPVLVGKGFFDDLPEIVVAAAAKPYDGYLGTQWKSSVWLYDTPSGKSISYTYKAKLVPLTGMEKAALALRTGAPGDLERWLPTNILH
jgi:Putative Flp pilus-assembly TadE/G-like